MRFHFFLLKLKRFWCYLIKTLFFAPFVCALLSIINWKLPNKCSNIFTKEMNSSNKTDLPTINKCKAVNKLKSLFESNDCESENNEESNKCNYLKKKYGQKSSKTVIICALLVIIYITLNNYMIMFVYYKSPATMSSSSPLPLSSYIHSSSNKRPPKQKPDKIQAQSEPIINDDQNSPSQFKVLIDPEDLEIANLNVFSDRNRLILPEAYFDEQFYSTTNNTKKLSLTDEIAYLSSYANNNQNNLSLNAKTSSPDQSGNMNHKKPCVHPKLNPFDSQIMQFVEKSKTKLACNPKENWIYIENGTLRVSKEAIRKHGTIVCAYIPLYRGNNDFVVYEGNRIFPVMDKMPLITDFLKIDCRSKDGGIYSNIHSGIAYQSSLHRRHVWNPMPKRALGYNVLMFGFDSVSRMSWIRMLPKSYEYMVKEGFVVLKGYNIVGDGTPQALLPILTGKKETELYEARRGYANASYVDNFPWIWQKYKKAGYVTQWAEDMQSIGTFQLRMLGFRKQPVDHYMRLFYLEAERYYSRFRYLCLGSLSRHQNIMNWVKEFFKVYQSKPKFSFIFHSEASHNYNNPLNLLDDDLLEFLKYLKTNGIMDNTILLFMSDHGVRVSELRQYSQGKLEERMPFFSIRMPRDFQLKYPQAMRNLRLNSRKLTTPFDIHETLKYFLNKDTQKQEIESGITRRGLNLFDFISPNRTCKDAQIEPHWCSCLNWIQINVLKDQKQNLATSSQLSIYTDSSIRIAQEAVNFINSLIDSENRALCRRLYLHSIEHLSKLDLNRELIAFKMSKDVHGREAVFDEIFSSKKNPNSEDNLLFLIKPKQPNMNISQASNETEESLYRKENDLFYQVVFQISLTTWPGQARYELSLKFNRLDGRFDFNKNEISRINSYNQTSSCIALERPDLRQFCVCK